MKKVLIVDDAAFVRMSLKLMLEKNGFQIVGEAEDGEDGIEKYVELHPDVVTMDITMPNMGGLEALKEIKHIDANSKVIMVSAMGQEKIICESVMLGAKSFIVKPFKEEHVIKTLTQVLAI